MIVYCLQEAIVDLNLRYLCVSKDLGIYTEVVISAGLPLIGLNLDIDVAIKEKVLAWLWPAVEDVTIQIVSIDEFNKYIDQDTAKKIFNTIETGTRL